MDAEANDFLSRFWVRHSFKGAREQGLDMLVVAEESLVQSMAVVTGHDPEAVRAELTAVFAKAAAEARALLEAKPAGEG